MIKFSAAKLNEDGSDTCGSAIMKSPATKASFSDIEFYSCSPVKNGQNTVKLSVRGATRNCFLRVVSCFNMLIRFDLFPAILETCKNLDSFKFTHWKSRQAINNSCRKGRRRRIIDGRNVVNYWICDCCCHCNYYRCCVCFLYKSVPI